MNTVEMMAMEFVGHKGAQLTPDLGRQLDRVADAWNARPTKKHTMEAQVASVARGLARVANPRLFGCTPEAAQVQLERAVRAAGVR